MNGIDFHHLGADRRWLRSTPLNCELMAAGLDCSSSSANWWASSPPDALQAAIEQFRARSLLVKCRLTSVGCVWFSSNPNWWLSRAA